MPQIRNVPYHTGRVATLLPFKNNTPFTKICRLRVIVSALRANVLSTLGCAWCTFLITVSRDYEIMFAYSVWAVWQRKRACVNMTCKLSFSQELTVVDVLCIILQARSSIMLTLESKIAYDRLIVVKYAYQQCGLWTHIKMPSFTYFYS